jgi:N-acetylglutamate synthase-like GNAT family acetyltransferase
MIRKCTDTDFSEILNIINDGASAYKGVIPEDRWHDPYMPEQELRKQITEAVEFWGYEENGKLMGVMGIQDKGDVTLIRHAYVKSIRRNKGIGSKLLRHLIGTTNKPVLIGTWAAATWAIDFYKKHGFYLLGKTEIEQLLQNYWSIPVRQVETSVVLASNDWKNKSDK